ncbi:hypothetical protein C1645_738771 [Glomus cerebriforme]|uniref:Uncharacterized protein n=1 Tax=Glomus cerebriforme TaxID=658196 RepID=A0A397ST37_9GLOM|nr:hypothetical protein C1645_738771 [Glomus cerebriforme]
MMEKELYSKICVAQSIKPIASKARNEVVDKKTTYKFSCNLATILVRDREVVVVRLKISDLCKVYISKNGPWLDKDVVYINKIEKYLRNISKDSPNESIANSDALASEIRIYCSNKLESRFKKLKKDLTCNPDNEYIKSFIEYASAEYKEFDPKKLNDVSRSKMSAICYYYCKQLNLSDKSAIPEKFLGYLRKVESYVASAVNIVECASKVKYKILFSNIKLRIMKPIIITDQPIYSWEYVIKSFVCNHVDYEHFKEECLKNNHIANRLKKVYSNKETGQLQLDDSNIKTYVYLHTEMNILATMIDQEDKSMTFIEVSKRCCYLCELYIDFVQEQGSFLGNIGRYITDGNSHKLQILTSGSDLLNIYWQILIES